MLEIRHANGEVTKVKDFFILRKKEVLSAFVIYSISVILSVLFIEYKKYAMTIFFILTLVLTGFIYLKIRREFYLSYKVDVDGITIHFKGKKIVYVPYDACLGYKLTNDLSSKKVKLTIFYYKFAQYESIDFGFVDANVVFQIEKYLLGKVRMLESHEVVGGVSF